MRNSWKLGACAALCGSVAFMGCGEPAGDDTGKGGSSSSSAGKGGLGSGGGSAGQTLGGSNAGKAGSAGAASGGAPTAGAGGGGGSAGNAGGVGGSGAGSGGTGGEPAQGGAAGACVEDHQFGAGGAGGAGGGFATAIVLIDNIVVKDAAAAAYKDWRFLTADDIQDSTASNIGDKWLRPMFGEAGAQDPANIGVTAAAHNVFSKCDGNPKGGAMAVVPFTAAAQYYELHNGFAQHDWHGYTVTADVKLLKGGAPAPSCPGHALLFVNGASGMTNGDSKLLVLGEWVSITLTAPAEATMIDRLGVRITSYECL